MDKTQKGLITHTLKEMEGSIDVMIGKCKPHPLLKSGVVVESYEVLKEYIGLVNNLLEGE